LCFGFRGYWQTHGGLEILGYPISEEFRQNGVTVQYFERARLEYHPENAAPWDIEGGLLGVQIYALKQ
ncbi:MAG TPA: L,D-transpeptidase, partial [Thermomicrobiaceae bacterium]|nr:L,D-transpeptidase [Thermomicrobiaceae bacterium]